MEISAQVSSSQEESKSEDTYRRRRQRLILLWHAKNCQEPAGTCTVKHCGYMKILLIHMTTCRDAKCPVHHCISSRAVLAHYEICPMKKRTSPCMICNPVRDSIRRSRMLERLRQHRKGISNKPNHGEISIDGENSLGFPQDMDTFTAQVDGTNPQANLNVTFCSVLSLGDEVEFSAPSKVPTPVPSNGGLIARQPCISLK